MFKSYTGIIAMAIGLLLNVAFRLDHSTPLAYPEMFTLIAGIQLGALVITIVYRAVLNRVAGTPARLAASLDHQEALELRALLNKRFVK